MPTLTIVTTTGVNLREQGLNTAPIRVVLPQGAQAEVLGNAAAWLQLRYDNQIGFAYMGNAQPVEAPGAGWSTYVTSPELNVRDTPSPSSSEVLGKMKSGERAAVTGFVSDWLRINYQGGVGFVKADYTSSVSQTGATINPATLNTLIAASVSQTGATINAASPDAAGAQTVAGKARLTPEEIAQLRDQIGKEPDAQTKGDRFEELQSRVMYASQRDNQAQENGKQVEDRPGQMCNLTSLSMALSYLGIPNPRPLMQYEDALETIRQEKHYDKRWKTIGWSSVALSLGPKTQIIEQKVKEGRAWWEANVRQAHLRKGHGVIMSIGRHIVRVQAVTEQGLVIDDPYGRSVLLPWEDDIPDDKPIPPGQWATWKSPGCANEYGKLGETAGEDVLWPWANVAAHRMRWIAAIGVDVPMVLGEEEEPIEYIEDYPAIPQELV